MNTLIVVADRARARLFVRTPAAERAMGGEPGLELLEIEALTDVEGALTGAQLFSNTRSGSNRSPHGALYEYDDHRQSHREEQERRFAKRIADSIRARLDPHVPARLVVAVEPRLLGLLRQELRSGVASSAEVVEIAKDFSRHTARHVQEELEHCGALPRSPIQPP